MQAATIYAEHLAGQPAPTPVFLWELAREYYRRAEAFDRTVCSGPVGHDGIMPVGHRELGQVNRHAADLMQEIKRLATAEGHSVKELKDAMRRYESSSQCTDDMRANFPS